MIHMSVKDTSRTVESLMKMSSASQKAYKAAIRMEAGLIETASKLEAPVDTGNMRDATFFSTDLKDDVDGITIELGYRAEYAIFVHENPTARHIVGKWKFLEDPLKRAQSGFSDRVAERMRSALGAK